MPHDEGRALKARERGDLGEHSCCGEVTLKVENHSVTHFEFMTQFLGIASKNRGKCNNNIKMNHWL